VIVAGAFIVLFGVAFLVTALISGLLMLSEARLRRRLLAAPRLTCAELRSPGTLPALVVVTGQTVPGRAGRLRSPAYDTDCIWYATTVTSGEDDDRTTFLRLNSGPEGEPIRIQDGTGSALLESTLVLQQSGSAGRLPKIRQERGSIDRHGSATGAIGHLVEAGLLPATARPRVTRRYLDVSEQTIEADQQVTVLARPRRTAHEESVLLRRKGVVNTGTPEQWLAELENDRTTARWMIVIFPLLGAALVALGLGLTWLGAS
jgi:hypothetical protein